MVGSNSETAADDPVTRKGSRRRISNLKVGHRIYLGFGIAFALVVALALIGLVALYGMSRGVGAFSASAGVARVAADVDIGIRDLQTAVRDSIAATGSEEAAQKVAASRAALAASLAALKGLQDDSDDRRAVAEAEAALARYAEGVEKLAALRQERAELLSTVLEPLVIQTRDNLAKLKDSGGIDSATLVGEAAISVLLVKDHAVRFSERHDPAEAQAMREELESATTRLAELNRYLWVAGTRQMINDLETMLGSLGGITDRLEGVVAEEEKLRTEILNPAAEAVAARAAEIRRHNATLADRLRTALDGTSSHFLTLALWAGGAVLAVALLAAWLVARSVAQPVDGVARAVTALAMGGGTPSVKLPADALERRDEIGAMARAVSILQTSSAETERQRREAEVANGDLLAARDRAEAENTAKTHFLVNMGHELHGPLSAIVDGAQSLMTSLHRQGASDLVNEVEMIQWSGEQLVGLVEMILDYAKIEAGTATLCLQDFDVGRLLSECRERVMPAADLHGNRVTIAPLPAGLGAMHSDFAKVRQALLALLDNGCKFTRNGAVTLSAQRVEKDGRAWIRFVVTDTGPGFAPSQAHRFFQPFVQGSNPDGGKVPGAGLGLTLTGYTAALLHGTVEVASAPGAGTRITLSLPAVHRTDDADLDSRTLTAQQALKVTELRALPSS